MKRVTCTALSGDGTVYRTTVDRRTRSEITGPQRSLPFAQASVGVFHFSEQR